MKRFLIVLLALPCLFSFSLQAAVSADQHWDNQFGPVGINAAPFGLVAVTSNKVYAAGSFLTAAGNTRANSVAGFDGTNWYQLESGLLANAAVVGFNADGNNVYAGGLFTNADDPQAINAARWDGTNWYNVGIQGVLEAVKRNSNNLYFCGAFSLGGSVNATNIARWDGTNYYALGTSVSGNGFSSLSSINCVAFQGNNVYVGGNFSFAGGSSATNIAYWDGNNWHAMGNPFNGVVDALQFFGGYLYVGGVFTNASLQLTNIARWNGTTWSATPGGGTTGGPGVYDMATNATTLFLAGAYTHIGGIAATSIVSFDGNNWTSMGSLLLFQGAAGSAYKLAFQSNQLYVAGAFERAGNAGACSIARWDGVNWWSLGGQTSKGISPASVNFVESLLQVNGTTVIPPGLYMGGLFSEAGSTVANCIARWDGTNWNALGNGLSGDLGGINGQRVNAMATDGTNLYAGGMFTNASGTYASCAAYWNGSTWNPMGLGVDYFIYAMATGPNNNIWVGGAFTNAGGSSSPGLSTWYFGSWHNLGNVQGNNYSVTALAYDGGTRVYIGGFFNTAGGVNATNIAYYDYNTSSMHPLGVGLQAGKVSALLYTNGILYAGGGFTNSSTTTLWRVAQWNGSSWSPLGSGIFGNGAATVNGIVASGGNIYVTGNFTNAGGTVATNVAYWDGSAWHAMGSGLDNTRQGSAIAANGNDVYVGGNFIWAGDRPSIFIAHWNAQSNYYSPANILLTRTLWQTNRQFKFRVTGTSGQDYIIQSSTNLASWTSLQTNSTMYYDFVDTNSPSLSKNFYRIVPGP